GARALGAAAARLGRRAGGATAEDGAPRSGEGAGATATQGGEPAPSSPGRTADASAGGAAFAAAPDRGDPQGAAPSAPGVGAPGQPGGGAADEDAGRAPHRGHREARAADRSVAAGSRAAGELPDHPELSQQGARGALDPGHSAGPTCA